MDAKITHEFWADSDGQPPEVKLTILWTITNATRDDCGVFRRSPPRFAFETGLAAEWLDRTLTEAAPKMFVLDGEKALLKNFLRYQIGTGPAMAKNNFSKGLHRDFQKLSERLQKAFLGLYPELKPLLSPYQALGKGLATTTKPLPRAYQGLPESPQPLPGFPKPLETGAVKTSGISGEAEPSLSPPEALAKPLPSPCQGVAASAEAQERKERKERRGEERKGECEGGAGEEGSGVRGQESADPGVGDPTLAEVLTRAGMIGMTEADGKAFFEHYAGLGWMYGNTRMANWWHWLPRWRARAQSFAQGKNAAPAPGSLAEIEDELAWQENPKRKAELLRKRAAMGGKS